MLTFDDGPDLFHTPVVLDELDRRGLKAIFFVNARYMVGSRPQDLARRDLVRKLAAHGHLVANHTLSHRNVCAEPETLDRFARTFECCGFRKASFYPCFGMAEGTLFVSGGEGPSQPRTLAVDRKALGRDRVVQAPAQTADFLTIVSCGKSMIDQRIVIAKNLLKAM